MNWSSGTNTIKEGDESKSLTLQMLEVKKQGGGTEYFVRKSDVNLGTKSVNKNGTYTAASDSKYGFSQFSVNVRGGNGSADSHGKPTGGDIKPGGAGSAVVGTDPETGNDVVVGVDEDGNLVNTPLPSSIVLVTPPTKTDYNDGETIDLSGAVVVAKMTDGTTWTDADHPNGYVSCTPEPGTADASAAKGWFVDSGWSVDGAGTYLGFVKERQFYKLNNGIAAAAFEYPQNNTSWVGPVLISTDLDAVRYNQGPHDYSMTVERGGLTFFVNREGHYGGTDNYGSALNFVPYTSISGVTDAIFEHIHISDTPGQTITLNWARPGDGKVLSTTMEINVSATSNAHSTESSIEGGSL